MKKIFLISFLVLLFASVGQAQQLYNMSFDQWSKTSGAWNLYPKGASNSQLVWDTANHGLSLLGINGTTPEYKHVAVPGKGKAAVKVESKKVLWAFVAGNLYTGRFIRIVDFAGAELEFGVPFTSRPKSLSGWYHYQPGTINYAKAPHKDKKGKTDEGSIDVSLLDCKSLSAIDTAKEKFVEAEKNPDCVGFGKLILKEDTKGYVKFELNIEYKNDKTPTYIVIAATPSRYGEFFTGSSDSVLYVDEWQFNY